MHYVSVLSPTLLLNTPSRRAILAMNEALVREGKASMYA